MEDYIDLLKNRGFKITPRRKAIIGIFLRSKSHLTPEEVWKELGKAFKRCGLPGVYRNLESMLNCGILTRIQQSDEKKHFSLCGVSERHHHHIACIKCGKVEHVEECGFEKMKKVKGYKIVSHFLQLNGICAECR